MCGWWAESAMMTSGGRCSADCSQEGIDVRDVAVDGSNVTGVAMIMVDAAGQNCIAAVYGANMACDDEQLDAAKRAMESADALMLQLRRRRTVSIAAASTCSQSWGARSVGPGTVRSDAKTGYAVADVITPNETEAAELTGIRVVDVDSARAAADALLAMGVGTAVVKMGQHGVFAATASERYYVPPFGVDAVDSVAAGDAFGAGLTVALSEARGLEDALRFASAAGALAVTKPGAQDAMPFRQEADALLHATNA
ncbi:Ribokinase [Geodia barretti]|uniref:Ribokinase n=1 Tax=Geodia barretti TaxID=519541 RepID=A0AA35RSZ0_GEOBA|nr:Ribokinase [Geodia barretti]